MRSLDTLTYCTNVHPGDSLSDVETSLRNVITDVKRRFSPDRRFNVGLRLSARAARELLEGDALLRFQAELDRNDFYTTTLNGFPYGPFHGRPIKEEVYRPDWLEPERVEYTRCLANVLVRLLADSELGSISTVPGCFAPRAGADSGAQMARALHDVVAHLVSLERDHGKRIVLALEPEPSCLLETTEQTLRFFETELLRREHLERHAGMLGAGTSECERLVRRHLGVCLDTCHASVEFERPLHAYQTYLARGVTIPKIQISAGLRLRDPDRAQLEALARYDEPVYLHQTVVLRGEVLHRYLDLPQALSAEAAPGGEWRVHFHVPVFHDALGLFESTQPDLVEFLRELGRQDADVQLEVETYTWDVLPAELRQRPLVEAIAEELRWAERHWGLAA